MLKELKSVIEALEHLKNPFDQLCETVKRASQKPLKDLNKTEIAKVIVQIENGLEKIRKEVLSEHKSN